MLICKNHKSWENQPQQQRRLCRQTLLPHPWRLRPRDPWAMQLKLQQTGEGAGGSPVPQNWAHSAKGAHPCRKACRSRGIKVAAPPLDSPCDGPVTYSGDTKILKRKKRTDAQIDFIFRQKCCMQFFFLRAWWPYHLTVFYDFFLKESDSVEMCSVISMVIGEWWTGKNLELRGPDLTL